MEKPLNIVVSRRVLRYFDLSLMMHPRAEPLTVVTSKLYNATF